MKLHVDLKERGYDIILERGALFKIKEYTNLKRKVMIVTDTKVPQTYIDSVIAQCDNYIVFCVESGESAKCFPMFIKLCEALLHHKFSRKDCILALGGGVVGDLTGYAAASYMRGIDFIQIPTTTLAQIDSSIGGKVAINVNEVKNVVGSFYQPKLVIIDPNTLATLSQRHFINGLVEALKAGLIYDPSLFTLFEQGNLDNDIDTIIYKALQVKKTIVEQDEKEANLRKILNFGHTIGHGIESYYHLSEYLHGECVAMGMLYFIDDEALKQRVKAIYKKLHLPLSVPYDADALFALLANDKKADGDTIDVIHVKKLGKAQITETSLTDIRAMLKG